MARRTTGSTTPKPDDPARGDTWRHLVVLGGWRLRAGRRRRTIGVISSTTTSTNTAAPMARNSHHSAVMRSAAVATSIGSPVPASCCLHTEWIERRPTARMGRWSLGGWARSSSLSSARCSLRRARRSPTPSCSTISPADGAVLAEAPAEAVLRFSEQVSLTGGSAAVLDDTGAHGLCGGERRRRQRRHPPRRRSRRRHVHDHVERDLGRLAPHQRSVGLPRRRAVRRRAGRRRRRRAGPGGACASPPRCSRPSPTPARSSASAAGGSRCCVARPAPAAERWAIGDRPGGGPRRRRRWSPRSRCASPASAAG